MGQPMRQEKTVAEYVCRYCGERLVGPGSKHAFIAPDRVEYPISVLNVQCNDGECLNAAQQVTKHDPIGWP